MKLLIVCLFMIGQLANNAIAQDHADHDHNHNHEVEHQEDHSHSHDDNHSQNGHAHDACGHLGTEDFDPQSVAMHHISDANVYTILDFVRIPLPCIVYSKDAGWDFFFSNKFSPGHHDDGHYAYNGYVLHQGNLKRVIEEGFPKDGKVEIGGFSHEDVEVDGKSVQKSYVCYDNARFSLDPRSTLDGGIMGGGLTSFYDLSITKNVVSMILVSLLLFFLFRAAAKAYQNREGKAPKGVQSLLEPVILYIRDEVAIPYIGKHKYEQYMPLLLSIFFFILGLNLWGQVPFLGGANVTGNLALTMVLAVIVFIITNIKGNKHYWSHILWMPGVPIFVKPLLTVIEIMGMFIKPLTLMLRLAGNITAGHIGILMFIGLIFIFGESGRNMTGSIVGSVLSVFLTMFMMCIELLVAFIQAFVFALLTATYIGAAVEEHEHH